MFSRLYDHCRCCSRSKKLDDWGFSPLAGEAAYISRQSNKSSARFASSKFLHRFLLSPLSSLASEDDISTLSSRLSLAFPLPPLPGSSVFHPPWCLPAQRAAPGLSSPKQAAFISGPLESHRSHLGSLIFLRPRISIWYLFSLVRDFPLLRSRPLWRGRGKKWPLTFCFPSVRSIQVLMIFSYRPFRGQALTYFPCLLSTQSIKHYTVKNSHKEFINYT